MNRTSTWNVKKGLNRLFLVFTVCWYVATGLFVWARWAGAIKAERAISRDLEQKKLLTAESAYATFIKGYEDGAAVEVYIMKKLHDELGRKPSKREILNSLSAAPGFHAHFRIEGIDTKAEAEALAAARGLRPPTWLTITMLLVPAGAYALRMAVAWIVRGFQGQQIT
jgi:hypothetical protein